MQAAYSCRILQADMSTLPDDHTSPSCPSSTACTRSAVSDASGSGSGKRRSEVKSKMLKKLPSTVNWESDDSMSPPPPRPLEPRSGGATPPEGLPAKRARTEETFATPPSHG